MAIWAQSGPQHHGPFSVFFPFYPYSVLLCSVKNCSCIPFTQARGHPHPNGTSITGNTHTHTRIYVYHLP